MICTNIALLIYLLFYHFFVKNIQYNLTDFETEYYEIHLMNSKEKWGIVLLRRKISTLIRFYVAELTNRNDAY